MSAIHEWKNERTNKLNENDNLHQRHASELSIHKSKTFRTLLVNKIELIWWIPDRFKMVCVFGCASRMHQCIHVCLYYYCFGSKYFIVPIDYELPATPTLIESKFFCFSGGKTNSVFSSFDTNNSISLTTASIRLNNESKEKCLSFTEVLKLN